VSADLTVLRLGMLGDLVMTEPALSWLAARDGLAVTLVTEPRYVETFDRLLPGVRVAPPGQAPSADLVLDLHRVHRSRRLREGRPWVGVAKEDLRRRALLVRPRLPIRPRRTWPERHIEAAARALRRLGQEPGERPEPIPRLPADAPREAGLLGISPGAGHEAKRWPAPRWRELVEAWPGRVVGFGAPDEADLVAATGAEPWPDPTLGGLVDGLSRCEVVVAADTGPLHLAAALGARVVGVFGPTPVEAGFWVWAGQGRVVRRAAPSCSPCSLHGAVACRRRRFACMTDLPASAVLEAALCG
jgi:ADP-heptose:LPS heptosyltransferase